MLDMLNFRDFCEFLRKLSLTYPTEYAVYSASNFDLLVVGWIRSFGQRSNGALRMWPCP